VLGGVWAGIAPTLMLCVYTIVFGVLVQPQWQQDIADKTLIPLIYFTGLIFYQFLLDAISRAPNIIREHSVYVRKVVFPVEIFAWTLIGSAVVRFLISYAILIVFFLLLQRSLPLGLLAMPVIMAPLVVMAVGLTWFLAGLGTYIRDVGQAVAVFSPVLMFVSPVFFPLASVPEPFRPLFYLNPISLPVEAMRALLFAGSSINPAAIAAYAAIALLIAAVGYRFFMRVRPGFADVL
jgi:lipopolysaccharide transport system permease protein